ncbi:MAG: hypothetical protein P4L90_14680 [Rhodopila sp.]|nr:hypothetical protein [Rhodopila sp.]
MKSGVFSGMPPVGASRDVVASLALVTAELSARPEATVATIRADAPSITAPILFIAYSPRMVVSKGRHWMLKLSMAIIRRQLSTLHMVLSGRGNKVSAI